MRGMIFSHDEVKTQDCNNHRPTVNIYALHIISTLGIQFYNHKSIYLVSERSLSR